MTTDTTTATQVPAPADTAGTAPTTAVADRRRSLTRLGIVAAVLTLLVAGDALFMQLSGYGGDDRNNFGMTDAATVWVAAAILAACTIALFLLRGRSTGSTAD